ncbi:MAG TPA: hypothetical protein VMM36_02075 [Opitutaceae bacterium]|nr:hypothetical protein [Opitutaceae bacterium]
MSAFNRVRVTVFCFALSCGVFAQTLPPRPAEPAGLPEDQPVIELSPFVISADAQTGWIATETLAGTRLRTNFKDVPNQIETLTKEFLDDLGLTSVEQSLMYTANVENRSDYVQTLTGLGLPKPDDGGRVRGISPGTLSRNFFQVRHPAATYNLERVTIASGPNAILFGLGSPAGILDATPAIALMRNKHGFTLRYDSEGSKSVTFDANSVIVPQKLAVRVMGLSQREFTEKKPNLDRDDRLYGAITFTPYRNTTVILQAERARRNWNYAFRVNPTDFVTLWNRANEIPGSGYTEPRPAFDNQSFLGIANNRIFVQAADAPVLIADGSVGLRNWRNSVTVKNPSSLPGVDPTFDASVNTTILDPAVFPFDANVVGTEGTTRSGATTTTVIIEQKLTDTLFLEIAYNHENAYEQNFAAGGSLTNNLNVDANQFVPGTTTPNPNFGKLYVQGLASTEPAFDRREDWRAALSYELNLAEKFDVRGGWGQWLGHHRFSGLYTGSKSDSKAQTGFIRRILDDPAIAGLTLQPKTRQGWAIHSTRMPQFRHYFDTPYDAATAAGPLSGDWSLTDANGAPFTLYLTDTPLHAEDGKRLAANQTSAGTRATTSAQILAWQGFFLPDRAKNDRLVLTFGYRKDSAKSATLDAGSTAQDFSGLYPVLWDTQFSDYGPTQTGINRNLGVVARPLTWLSVFYNDSTTFDLNIGRFDPFGNEIPGASGKGNDFGLRFDLWRDKVSLRINRYKNALGPQRAGNQINVFRDIFFNLEDRVRTLDPQAPTINVVDGNRRGFRVAGRVNYFIMSDLESTGYEFELNVTPVPSWNIRVNGAISEAIETNVGGPWFEWAAQRLPVWQAVVAKNGEVDAAGQPVTWRTAPASVTNPNGQTLEQYYNSALVGQAFAFMQAVDGRATDGARGARANMISNYSFSQGPLKGFNLGGAIRWRAAPTIGYGVTTNAAGATVLDLDRSYKGEEELTFDAFVGYRGRLQAFGGLRYRVQLNVRNLFDEDEAVPVARITTGAVAKIATVEPRVFIATFGVEF